MNVRGLITARVFEFFVLRSDKNVVGAPPFPPQGHNSLFKTCLRELMPDVVYKFYKCYEIKISFYSHLCIFVHKNTEKQR